jgi:RNA-directed DNA polymerase
MGKTIKNEYEKALSYEALMKAHMQSRKGKGYRKDIILFNLKQEEYIMWLYEQLKTLKYKHGGYTVFYITEPKLRRIEKSKYLDRIVHRWYVNSFIKPYFVPQFIETSYACLENKGMHKACLDVQGTMKHCKNIWGEYYILKMDIKKYFENINKNIVYEILQRKIKDEKVLWLTKEILYSNNGENNLPIGNYTSQMFANIYLNELDQYVKHKLKGKYYFRYMDDAILIRKTKEETKQDLENIKEFLREQLKLELNKKTQIFKNKQGINFCGYKINEYRLKIRDKGKRKLKIKVKKLEEKVKKGIINSKEAKRYLAGHLGYMKIANVKNLKERLFF